MVHVFPVNCSPLVMSTLVVLLIGIVMGVQWLPIKYV